MNIKQRVEQVLEDYPAARNSDNVLFQSYYIKYFDFDTSIHRFFNLMPPLMSLSRARRQIQHEGFYPSDRQIKARRKELEEEYRKEYSNHG
jgi:hypothetical protein